MISVKTEYSDSDDDFNPPITKKARQEASAKKDVFVLSSDTDEEANVRKLQCSMFDFKPCSYVIIERYRDNRGE